MSLHSSNMSNGQEYTHSNKAKESNTEEEEMKQDVTATTEFETNWDKIVEYFDHMGLQDVLLRGIYAYGWENPSGIQQRAIIPVVLKHDIICQALSGTCKTG
eukprot:753935_1